MNIRGNDWEDLCEACLQEKYKDEIFVPVTARTQGDWGMDGFTKTGIIIQCYNPDEEFLPPKEHYDKLRDKINTDLQKVEKNKADIKILMEGKKVKSWILLTYQILNKDIHKYAAKKAKEYREKKLDILDKDFKVVVEPFSFIKNYVQSSNFNKKLSYSNSISEYNEKLEQELNSEYLNNLDRKLKALFGTKESLIISLKQTNILKYSIGMEICEKFQKDFPKKYEKFLEVIKTFELNLEEEVLIMSGDKSDKKIFSEIREKLDKKLKEVFSNELDCVFLDKLKDYYISFWLLRCPLNFEKIEEKE